MHPFSFQNANHQNAPESAQNQFSNPPISVFSPAHNNAQTGLQNPLTTFASHPPSLDHNAPEPAPPVGQIPPPYDPQDDKRLAEMERNEHKRRLIRDARALAKQYKMTQAQMAEEMGVPRRTLEDWLQYRRMPKAPGTTLLRRWVEEYSQEINCNSLNYSHRKTQGVSHF